MKQKEDENIVVEHYEMQLEIDLKYELAEAIMISTSQSRKAEKIVLLCCCCC